jgi:ATP/maltotriose-dependent transcriptional regulator MalT
MATEVRHARLLTRRIIERPRLYALLDESTARVRTLVAPAGYGKTTLAEQWVERDGRRGTWYTARRSSADVAALALGVARAANAFIEGCDLRLREHLRAVPAAAERVDVLAELLGQDLAGWPSDSWLVLDEYQELARSSDAERFVAALIAAAPIRLLVAGRQRPSWVTTRGLLYGEFLELNQTVLAMDSTEAAEVLAGRSAQSAAGLVALANGWPAVIGLAAVSSAEFEGEIEVPESLYGFFAEEVLSALGEEVRSGLAALAVAPVLDHDLAAELLGPDGTEVVCTAALDVGVLVERGPHLELHPLVRTFLDEHAERLGAAATADLVARCLACYRARRDWDAAFELISRHGPAHELEPLLLAALDELLDTARLPTLETWCALAAELGCETPAFTLARAEIALRTGRHAEAQAFGESVAESGRPELVYRALSLAGRAAHLASREEEALVLYRRAEDAADTDRERRDARWGQLMCASELELPEATTVLHELTPGVRFSDPREVVRAAGCTLSYQLRLGSLDMPAADRASELLDAVRDPFVTSSFQSVYSTALGLSARYEDALRVARDLGELAKRYRFDFAVPYALCSAAMAHAGLRQWHESERALNRAMHAARSSRDAHAEQISFALYQRVLCQQGRLDAALAMAMPDLGRALPAAGAEVLCARGLVLASAMRCDDALALVARAHGTSHAIEPAVLAAATEAVAALKKRSPDALGLVARLREIAFSTGAVDILVTAYRANSDLLAVLLRQSRGDETLVGLIRRARDEDLADLVGHSLPMADDPRARLSPREREVYSLLREGMSNRQIAQLLVISEATVKVHVHHIFDKLGVRSRVALAMQAILERSDQATSATDESAADVS